MAYHLGRLKRTVAAVVGFVALATSFSSPTAAAQAPYPDLSDFRQIPVSDLPMYAQINRDGVWFTTPVGVNCAIGEDGAFGCSGPLKGVPRGENEIGWFPGDPFPRLYRADEPRFATGKYQQILGAWEKLTYRGSTCAVTRQAEVYCLHGDDANSQLMVGNYTTYRGSGALPSD